MNKAYEPKFNYILNDLALSNLITRNLYSKDVTYDDKRELENQIELIQQENKQLKDNWNKLKQIIDVKMYNSEYLINLCGYKVDIDTLEILKIIKEEMQELEQGSDSE